MVKVFSESIQTLSYYELFSLYPVIEQLFSRGSNPFFYFHVSLIMLMTYVLLGTHPCFSNMFKNEVAYLSPVYVG